MNSETSEAIARYRRKADRLKNDPDVQDRHARWVVENRRQCREEPQREKPPSRGLVESLHVWAAAHPDLIPDGQGTRVHPEWTGDVRID